MFTLVWTFSGLNPSRSGCDNVIERLGVYVICLIFSTCDVGVHLQAARLRQPMTEIMECHITI